MEELENYVIVVFNDNGVQLVPKTWIVGNKTYWPTFTSNSRYEKAVRGLETPDKEWPLFKIRILGSFSDFEIAKKKRKVAEVLSDLNSDCDEEEKKKRRRERMKKTYVTDDDSDDDVDDGPTLVLKKAKMPKKPVLPSPPRPASPLSFFPPTTPTCSQKLFSPNSRDISPGIVSISSGVGMCSGECTSKLNKMAQEISEIKVTVKTLLEINLDMMKNQKPNNAPNQAMTRQEMEELLQDMPLKSVEAAKNFNQKLESTETMEKLVHIFSQLGGKSVDSCVKAVLSKLLTNHTASKLNMGGGKGKEPLDKTYLLQAIIMGVRANYPNKRITDEEIVGCIRNWLRHAPARAENEAKRLNKENAAANENNLL